MRTHKATFSLPEKVLNELGVFVEERQRSHFVAEAIRHALETRKKHLEEAYKAAASDRKRLDEIEDWEPTA